MSAENKFARLMRNTGPARFFIPVGIVLIIFGIILLSFNTGKYVETTGKIINVIENPVEADENQTYDLTIRYTVDGKDYETTFSLGGSFNAGDDIKVFYDPDNPTHTTNSKTGNLFAFGALGVGAAALIFGVYKTVMAFKKSKTLDESIPGGGKFPTEAFEGFKTADGVTEYYFRFDGHSLKPGYIIEDADRKFLFEGKMTKQALIGACTYEFHNHVNGAVESHAVGHTMTQTYNDEFFSAKSWFKFDGKNIWDVIHERGVRISTGLFSKFPNTVYDVARNGAPFAKVETCGVYVHEDEAAQHKINIPTGHMYYRFWTNSNDFETLFLTIFAISETEQGVVE